jgi:hypothetical protein
MPNVAYSLSVISEAGLIWLKFILLFSFKLESNFNTAADASKIDSRFKKSQNWLKSNYIATLVYVVFQRFIQAELKITLLH